MVKRLLIMLVALSALPGLAHADETDLARTGQELREHPDTEVEVDGYFRTRSEALYNLDLDRGPTPSGQYAYPLPMASPRSQWLGGADMRLRTDLSLYTLGGTAAVNVRLDVLDNLMFGSTPEGNPLTTTSQEPPGDALQLKRAYGEMLTPVGVLLAGRMGAHWGLGMLANGGDCADCDSGDASDRIALVTPLADHLWAFGYDVAYRGPTTSRSYETRSLDLDPSDDVHAVTFAGMRWNSPLSRERRLEADMATLDYGATASHRWQQSDVPAAWLEDRDSSELGPAQVVERDFSSWVFDAYVQLVHPWARLGLEGAYMTAEIGQPSTLPGVEFDQPITSNQYGFAFESDIGPYDGPIWAGLDAGMASGDSAPGFGSSVGLADETPVEGDLHGAQANPPRDNEINNFLFHPDYHIDQILFREIIGTVTDARYLRPHMTWHIAKLGPGRFRADATAIASWAVNEQSTPGDGHHLGLEFNPSLTYEHENGFSLTGDYALLLPGAGLDNPDEDLTARPAQMLRARLMYGF